MKRWIFVLWMAFEAVVIASERGDEEDRGRNTPRITVVREADLHERIEEGESCYYTIFTFYFDGEPYNRIGVKKEGKASKAYVPAAVYFNSKKKFFQFPEQLDPPLKEKIETYLTTSRDIFYRLETK